MAGFLKIHQAWARRVLVEPAAKRMARKPFRDAAVKFLERGVGDLCFANKKATASSLADEGQKLLDAGCDEPAIVYLVERIKFRVDLDWRKGRNILGAVMRRIEPDATYPRALLCFIGKDLIALRKRAHDVEPNFNERLAVWTKGALNDGSYLPEDGDVFIEHMMNSQWIGAFNENMGLYIDACVGSKMPEWVSQTLDGARELKLAWKARGSGWADSVTSKGWDDFKEHLELADVHFSLSWKQHPENPYAATRMIRVVMGGGGEEGDTLELWFQRAAAARFDFYESYDAMSFALTPRWGGSIEQMLAFARAARDTRQDQTIVPFMFYGIVMSDLSSEMGGTLKFIKARPDVAKEIVDFIQEQIRTGNHIYRDDWPSELAIFAWQTGQFELAKSAIDSLTQEQRERWLKIAFSRKSSAEMIAEISLHLGKGWPEYEEAQRATMEFDYVKARAALQAAQKVASPDAQPFLGTRLRMLDFEQEFEKGEWMKLEPAKTWDQWVTLSGKWSVNEAGDLINDGSETDGMIIYRGRIGANYEVRGDFEIKTTNNCCRNLGVVVGFQNQATEDQFCCTTFQQGRSGMIGTITQSSYGINGPAVPITPKAVNHFIVRCENGKLSYSVNGKKIFANFEPQGGDITNDQTVFGLSAPNFCWNNITKVRNLEVRRIE